jgi:glycine hydroxymethyltransferase
LCTGKYARRIDRAVFPALQGGPHNNVIAALAVALREAATDDFKAYAHHIVANSRALAATLVDEGASVITGGSDNHLIIFDATSLDATGKEAAVAMDLAGLEANANTIPYDPRPPMDPSGVRIGTPALTSRGLGEAEMALVGRWIVRAIRSRQDAAELGRIRSEVFELMAAWPAPGFEAPWPDRALLA